KSLNVNCPSSSTYGTNKSLLKSTNVTTNLSIHNRQSVCTLNSIRLSNSKQIKTMQSYNCQKLNPFDQAKVLLQELNQWQQKRLKRNSELGDDNHMIPEANTHHRLLVDVNKNISIISKDNATTTTSSSRIGLKSSHECIQIE
ncbi:unnamed protein product, partial [Schistosoma turkestanicum]